jgi:regulator of cell morphogenesis and NO signaling
MGVGKTVIELHGEEIYETVVFYPEELLSVPELLDHIVNHHHEYMKEMLYETGIIAEIVEEDYNDLDDQLDLVLFNFRKFAANLFEHIQKEQVILFPKIKALLESESNSYDRAFLVNLKNPISAMIKEHDALAVDLEYLRSLTDEYNAPQWGGPLVARLYQNLEKIERDMLLNIQKEDTILYPKVIDFQRSLDRP